MRCRAILPALLAGFASTAALADTVDLSILSQKVTVDRATQVANFSITFNRTPDFTTISNNAQVEAFQYEIDVNSTNFKTPLNTSSIDSVIRGGEIFEGQGIPVRLPTGDGGDNSGGWGPIRATLPFDLSGNTIKFSAPISDLGGGNGEFRYRTLAFDNGAITTQSSGAVVPLPAGFWPGLVLLGGLAVGRKMRVLQRI